MYVRSLDVLDVSRLVLGQSGLRLRQKHRYEAVLSNIEIVGINSAIFRALAPVQSTRQTQDNVSPILLGSFRFIPKT